MVDFVSLLMADPIDRQAVREEMAQFCALDPEEAHVVLTAAWDAWEGGCFAGSAARLEFIEATLVLLDTFMNFPPPVRLVLGKTARVRRA